MNKVDRVETDDFLQTRLPGETPAMVALRSRIFDLNLWNRHAPGQVRCVLITGETGVGKYQLAKLIVQHDQWNRASGQLPSPAQFKGAAVPLTRVLVTAVNNALAESELFGYVRGAYTGAAKDHPGLFGDTDIKNVLLDEIGDCSLEFQAKLLQVIEDGTFHPIGARKSTVFKTEARVFLATRRSLRELVEKGTFRDDLYYRIAPFRLHIPPLRERADEIPNHLSLMIAERTADLNLTVLGLPKSPAVTGPDLEFAMRYPWPGNLRQLADAVQSWLLCGCRSSFSDVVRQMESVAMNADGGLGSIVSERLNAVLAGRRQPYGKVGELVEEIFDEVRAAVYDAYHEDSIDKHEWVKVFPAQNIANIRTSISSLAPGRSRDRSSE